MDSSLSDPRVDRYAAPAPQEMDYERMREIRLSVTLSETNVPQGHYYLLDFNVPKGEKAKHEDIGPEITVHFLRYAMKVRKWDQDQGMTVMDSTEFRKFSDVVILYNVFSQPTQIVAALPYTHRNKELPSIGGKSEKSLKMQLGLTVRYVAYVLYKDEVCRFNFTATDNSGADEKDKPLQFGEELSDSFSGMLHSIDEDQRNRLFFFPVTLRSKKNVIGKDGNGDPMYSKKLMPKTFEAGPMVTDADKQKQILDHIDALYKQLAEQMWNKYTKAREATPMETLDMWSRRILEKVDAAGPEPILFSDTEKMKALPQEGEVIEVRAVLTSPPSGGVGGDDDFLPDINEDREEEKKIGRKEETVGDAAKEPSALKAIFAASAKSKAENESAGDESVAAGENAGGDESEGRTKRGRRASS